jgi:polysaccharide biosynthesis/export protein
MNRLIAFFVALFAVFAVAVTTAQASSYRLKAGDTLEVNVWQDQKLNRQVLVGPDGFISFPLAGQLRAGGKTVDALGVELQARLQKQYVDKIDVTVSIASVKEIPPPPEEPLPPPVPPIDPSFYATGEVARPGKYSFNVATNLLQGIAMAGGLGPFAAERRIKLRRKENGVETLYEFDYEAFISGKDLSGNMRLHSGDVIIVPEKGIFE